MRVGSSFLIMFELVPIGCKIQEKHIGMNLLSVFILKDKTPLEIRERESIVIVL